MEAFYLDRNERQTYRLEHTPSGWPVAAVDLVRSRSPDKTYGSPVSFAVSHRVTVPVAEPGPE